MGVVHNNFKNESRYTLLFGSKIFEFWRVDNLLKQRVFAEINLDNIINNINQIKKTIRDTTNIIGVVKADAYGHGAIEVSKTLIHSNITNLAVATCDEGIELRQNKIFVPILVFGYTQNEKLVDIIINNLTQTVFSLETAVALSNIALKFNKVVRIHIKIDTGMGRLGFPPTKHTVEQIIKILNLPCVSVLGIYTHFAVADTTDKIFVYEQLKQFNYVLKLLKQNNINIPCHVSNSAATIDIGDFDMDYVRPGISIYGLPPSNQTKFDSYDFLPAMSVKSQVSFLKQVDAGVSVGYGRTFFTNKITKIATIPVGYADGYARAYSNKGRVIINGQYANIIGNVCMDQFMVDVTHIKNINIEDEVILLGTQGDKTITATELADMRDTISYEVVCNISKRVPRTYIKNNE